MASPLTELPQGMFAGMCFATRVGILCGSLLCILLVWAASLNHFGLQCVVQHYEMWGVLAHVVKDYISKDAIHMQKKCAGRQVPFYTDTLCSFHQRGGNFHREYCIFGRHVKATFSFVLYAPLWRSVSRSVGQSVWMHIGELATFLSETPNHNAFYMEDQRGACICVRKRFHSL